MAHLKDLIVNGVSRFIGKVFINDSHINTINGVSVTETPKFTDTVTTVTTSGSGNAVTAISASNGAVTATKGTTFLTSHQDISGKADKNATVSTVAWDSTNKKLTKTINGSTTDVVTAATLRTDLNVANGAQVNQNAFSNVKVGSTTVAADTKTDTLELVAGSNVTLTPDATNDKVTIAATDTTYQSKAAASGGTEVSLVTTGQKYTWNNKTSNTGTVTSVAVSNDTNGGLTVSGSPITSSGTVKLKHTNQVTAQNTQAIYPIKIDVNGHISAYGSAVTPLTASSTLDATKLSGTVPTGCLPSYVDDVLEYTAKANFPATGQTGKIYVDKTTNLTWRWGGSTYVQISPSLALGTTSSTAFRGDYGNTAYTHAVTNKGSAFSSGLYKITTNSEGHVTAATAVQKSDITGLGIPGTNTVTTVTTSGSGNAVTAISASNGAVTATKGATFLTQHQNMYEAKLVWGGQNFSGAYGCIDAAMIENLGANRFAFLRAAGLTIEYSTDGGTNWVDYGTSNENKTGLFGKGQNFWLGKHSVNGSSTLNDMLRVTIATGAAQLYTNLNKIAIYMATFGNTVQVKMEKALENTPTNFITHLDWTDISGWSGWNILNISNLTTYGNSPASQYGRIRFIFKQIAINNGSYTAAIISRIMGFGGMGWIVPSSMAENGHLYSYDNAQNATFPAKVTATAFNGNATSATNAMNLLAYNRNEITVGANSSSAGSSTNDSVWFNYRDISGGTISNNATKLIHYHFGNRKGSTSDVTVHAETFNGNLTGSATKVNNHTVNSDVPENAVFTDTKNTAGSTNTSSKIFLIGATSQAANPQTYSHDTAYVGTDGKLYSNSKVVLTGGSNASSTVTITPSTTDIYSMTSTGNVTPGAANTPTVIDTSKFSGGSFTRGTFNQGTLPTLTFAMDTTDTKKLKISFTQGTLPTHANDSFTAAAIQSGFYTAGTANTPTAVTLPGRSSVIKAWTGYTAATAAAQTFTGSSS